MQTFFIRRKSNWKDTSELSTTAGVSARVGNEEMPDKIRWICSYVVREDDGRLGTVCIYQGTDEAAIRGLVAAWSRALEARDVDGLVAHYAPDAVIYDCVAWAARMDREGLRRTWEACLPHFPARFRSEHRDLVVRPAGGAPARHRQSRPDDGRAGFQHRPRHRRSEVGGTWRPPERQRSHQLAGAAQPTGQRLCRAGACAPFHRARLCRRPARTARTLGLDAQHGQLVGGQRRDAAPAPRSTT